MNLSRKSKRILIVFGALLIVGYSSYKYVFKPHKSIEQLELKFSGTSEAFLKKADGNVSTWEGMAIELKGVVTSIDKRGITLNGSIYCQLLDKNFVAVLQVGQDIRIKGRVIGYDDLLEEIKLDQTIIK